MKSYGPYDIMDTMISYIYMKSLYDFVDSLSLNIFTEPGIDKYELIQPFPFKSYSDPQRTLEEEKLFPNAVLQIREL